MAEPVNYTNQMSPEYFEKQFGYIFKTKHANILGERFIKMIN